MEITVEPINTPYFNYSYDDYTAYVDCHHILTIVTDCMVTPSKCIKGVLKCHRTMDGIVLVGLSVNYERVRFTKEGLQDSPYDLLELCIGSHCLLYYLPDPWEYVTPKLLNDFKVKNPIDLGKLAIERLGRYDLDRLVKFVLGKHMDVVRPEEVKWFEGRTNYYFLAPELSCEKVKFATVDPYLCFLIGYELLDMIDGSSSSFSSCCRRHCCCSSSSSFSDSSSNKKKKKKNKSKKKKSKRKKKNSKKLRKKIKEKKRGNKNDTKRKNKKNKSREVKYLRRFLDQYVKLCAQSHRLCTN